MACAASGLGGRGAGRVSPALACGEELVCDLVWLAADPETNASKKKSTDKKRLRIKTTTILPPGDHGDTSCVPVDTL
jgi:hypothetical protein